MVFSKKKNYDYLMVDLDPRWQVPLDRTSDLPGGCTLSHNFCNSTIARGESKSGRILRASRDDDTVGWFRNPGGNQLRLVGYPIVYKGFSTIPAGCLVFLLIPWEEERDDIDEDGVW